MSFGILSRARRHEPALALLLLRLWAGWEFARAGWVKLSGGIQAPAWFRGLDMPIPQSWLPADVNWLAAGILELLLGLALIVGLSTRWAAGLLLYIVFVAVYAVHFDLGWKGWNQIDTDDGLGFKVPLMLALMLFALFACGAGSFSLDRLMLGRRKAG
ncbi:DoxX family protein [Bordetella hinzii]|uniref:DoxX family membrane protein n=1 Tax=Bordetella hinzii TaxID=103855 RepID=UPI0013EFE73D|nr:DoxX family protein [Bordetella hinzii]QII83427.1 DoxX family protein [Bordetella hinzii]